MDVCIISETECELTGDSRGRGLLFFYFMDFDRFVLFFYSPLSCGPLHTGVGSFRVKNTGFYVFLLRKTACGQKPSGYRF